ncbi:MAG: hypothetical protein IJY31_00255 [Muribaculaceae bacterium]|nr:hypothetical protein [Muribaculaceae bacterium]
MVKEIKYNGYSATPSDYECPDGDLSTAINLLPEDGMLKPVLPPETLFTLETGYSVIYIHETSVFRHYIIKNGSNLLYWSDSKNTDKKTCIRGFLVSSVCSIGNILLINTPNDGIHYLLWQNYTYTHLGTHLPELPISFGLQGQLVHDGSKHIDTLYSKDYFYDRTFSTEFQDIITGSVLATVNSFIAEESTKKGRFIFPFFVRYAYRLYDGSLTMHSAPVLMIASSGLTPQVFCHQLVINGDNNIGTIRYTVAAPVHQLDYAVLSQGAIAEIKKWEDIITGVDVFISAPIYTYDQNGKITKVSSSYSDSSYCVCKNLQSTSQLYSKYTFGDMLAIDPCGLNTMAGVFDIPAKDTKKVIDDVRSCSQFYFLKSLKLEDLSTDRTIIEIDKDYLQSLVTREVMTDDYDSHDKLFPEHMFTYNSRLNIAGLSKYPYNGYNAGALFNYTNFALSDLTVYFYIKHEGETLVVKGDSSQLSPAAPYVFLFYPNVNAYKAVIRFKNNNGCEVKLIRHDFLNGAFYFDGWGSLTFTSIEQPTSIQSKPIYLPNKIYTSEINSPFVFPVTGINTVGTGTIFGISTAAKALSQGQFGQFPLYAFTSEGVWALEVSSTGTYSTRQPVTRDVCISPDSITQLDSAVLFASDRGIMLLSGSNAQCISDNLNTDDPFLMSGLPRADKIADIYNGIGAVYGNISIGDITLKPFSEFLGKCRMIYDYVHQRVIVYNPDVRYAYVWSTKTQGWGMMLSDIRNNVNSYPEALAMTSDSRLVDFSSSTADGSAALLVTRPFKMDGPDTFKTVDTVIQRGKFRRDSVKQILYASNDLYNWHIVWSSTDMYMRGFSGSPYKYFRLALVCDFDKSESLYGFSVQFTPRMTGQLR